MTSMKVTFRKLDDSHETYIKIDADDKHETCIEITVYDKHDTYVKMNNCRHKLAWQVCPSHYQLVNTCGWILYLYM